MQWFAVVMMVMKCLGDILKAAEEAFKGIPESGATKKQWAMAMIHIAIEGIDDFVLTPEIWDRIEKLISPAIDIACMFLFPNEEKA